MAGAVPGELIGIPLQLAAQVRTARGDDVAYAVDILVDARFVTVDGDNPAVSPGQIGETVLGNGKKLFGKPFERLRRVRGQFPGGGGKLPAAKAL